MTVREISADTLVRARLAAQWLGGSATARGRSVVDVAHRMLALQGQDWRSSRWALGVRAPGTTVADVAAAFNDAEVVRSWPMRGTIHVVPAEDIGWMQRLTNAGPLAGAPKRREFLGITDAMLDRLVEVSIAALGDGPQTRDSIAAAWTEAGIEWKSNWRYHLIWWLCQNGIAVFGPTEGAAEPGLVLVEGWIRSPRNLEGDEALVELASRYASARGPVRAKDLAWWAGIGVREARRGLGLAVESDTLMPMSCDGDALWADPETLDAPEPPEWLLLPAFDEHLLGYTDREAQLDAAHFEHIVPGRNGMFLATVVHRGRVVGTWKRGTRRNSGPELTPLPGEALDEAALAPEVERWRAFHGE